MYIDARKFKYSSPLSNEDRQAIARDKKFTEDAYGKWLLSNVSNIVERLWEIDDIGVVEKIGEFVKLLKEAEFTYSLGAYKSTIALIGVSAEDLCRFFSTASGHNLDSLTQNDRIRKLHSLGLFDSSVKDDFHEIRKLRNDCLHFNAGFRSKSEDDLKSDALASINRLKTVYAKVIGITSYNSIDSKKLIDILALIAKEASTGNHDGVANLDDAVIRTRNIFSQVTGIDLSINFGGAPVFTWSNYLVEDMDFDAHPPEVTLKDLQNSLVVIVDITDNEVELLRSMSLSKGEVISAAIGSVTNGLGMSAEWRFLSIPTKNG